MATKKRARRKVRRNADDNLRKLERKAIVGSPREIADYWLACLRAGELPKHNYVLPITGSKVWTMHVEYVQLVEGTPWRDLPPRVIDQTFSNQYEVILPGGHTSYVKSLKEALEALLARPNPPKQRRKNADDRLRKLERAASATSDPTAKKTALLEYWRAMLQAGQVPPPTLVLDRTQLWVLPDSSPEGRYGPNSHVTLLLFSPEYGAPGAKLTLHTNLQDDRFYGSVETAKLMLPKFLKSLVEDTLHDA